ADVRARLKTGELTVPDLLAQAERDPRLAAMRVSALIAALPGYGPARSGALMRRLRIAESRRIRGLGPKQRVALLASVTDPAELGS
ncbi:MAG TPA: integration host factor, actinobacterial type, partial [Jatrophihabitans sp.]|nr:integration host factor, actinobacterial type [Jatrophihabitans sp.]